MALLPAQLSTFIGREREIADVGRRLSTTRLLTLTGPGGVGKTRLALAAAALAEAAFSAGVVFVPLAAVRDPTLVMPAIATSLGLAVPPRREVLDVLSDGLAGQRMLLVLDNLEQVADAAEDLADLLVACPDLTLLVTSRTPLHIAGEQELPVQPLGLPRHGVEAAHVEANEPEESEAVRLFVQRVCEHRPDFRLTAENATVVADICRRLDGLPLAIELAAPRVKVLGLHSLLGRLDQRLALLTGGARHLPARQQTMRETIAWSYDLLTDAQQRLFRALSAFVGGWTLEAAEAVAPCVVDVLDALGALIDHSIVWQAEQPNGDLRYGMLEVVRDYGLERLAAAGESDQASTNHALHVLTWVETMQGCKATDDLHVIALLAAEHNNIRAALHWILSNETSQTAHIDVAVRACSLLWAFWRTRGLVSEGRGWLDLALARSDHATADRGMALTASGILAAEQGAFQYALACHEEHLALARARQDTEGVVWALWGLGRVSMWQGDVMRSVSVYEEGIAIAREFARNDLLQAFLANFGSVLILMGDLDRAVMVLDEGEVALHAAGMRDSPSIGDDRGLVALLRGQFDLARRIFQANLGTEREFGPSRFVVNCVEHLGWVAALTQQPSAAATLLGAADRLREVIGAPIPPAYRARNAYYLKVGKDQVDESVWSAAWMRGRALPLDEALDLALALDLTPDISQTPQLNSVLSPREVEVLRLIVGGMTDREIAATLNISHHTVMRHVSHILNKLDVESRTAAATWAVRQNLI